MREENKMKSALEMSFWLCLNICSRWGAHHCRCMYCRGPLEQNGPRVCASGRIELWGWGKRLSRQNGSQSLHWSPRTWDSCTLECIYASRVIDVEKPQVVSSENFWYVSFIWENMGVYEFSSSVLRQNLTSSCWPPTWYVTEVGLELLSLMPGYGPLAIEDCEKRMSRVWQGCLAVSTSGIKKHFCPMLAAVWLSEELLISPDTGLHMKELAWESS